MLVKINEQRRTGGATNMLGNVETLTMFHMYFNVF